MNLRELTSGESFDPNTLSPHVPFTQAAFYGAWQEKLGRKVRRFVVEREGKVIAYIQLIRYPLLRGKQYLYAPYGPVTAESSPELLAFLNEKLKGIGSEERAAFIRLDFTPPIAREKLSPLFTEAKPYTYHSAYFQPRVEWYLDLGKSEEELIADMHEKTRYSIRTAEKRGVETEVVTQDFGRYLNIFYELMSVTAKRNGFSLHPRAYYESIFASLASVPDSYLVIARYGEKVLVVDLFIVSGGVANHVFGCSSDEERDRLPNYLAQLAAIRHAKQLGCASYNFGGIATDDYPSAGWAGLTRFKRRFGGREVRHGAFLDLVVSPFWYFLYNFRKRLQNRK
jgi:lipid II:glycine glycyltransferase (peptidoglycan interpeptide bridge formation enzyme)